MYSVQCNVYGVKYTLNSVQLTVYSGPILLMFFGGSVQICKVTLNVILKTCTVNVGQGLLIFISPLMLTACTDWHFTVHHVSA